MIVGKNVNGVVKKDELNGKYPSLLYYTTVNKGSTRTVSLPFHVRSASNLTVTCTPLDHGYTYKTPSSWSVYEDKSMTSTDYNNFYIVPMTHIAVVSDGKLFVNKNPITETLADKYARYAAQGVVNNYGKKYELFQFLSMTVKKLYQNGFYKSAKTDEYLLFYCRYLIGNENIANWVYSKLPESSYIEDDILLGSGKLKTYHYCEDNTTPMYGWGDFPEEPSQVNDTAYMYLNSTSNTLHAKKEYVYTKETEGYDSRNIDDPYYTIMTCAYTTVDYSFVAAFNELIGNVTPKIKPDFSNSACNTLVCVYGDLTREQVEAAGLDHGYGIADLHGTINQNYSNLFLYQQSKVLINTTYGTSEIGYPGKLSKNNMYQSVSTGSGMNSYTPGVIQVPIQAGINYGKPALVVVDTVKTTSMLGFIFLGFSTNGSQYTHANFYFPQLSKFYLFGNTVELVFSIYSDCPQFCGKYTQSYTTSGANLPIIVKKYSSGSKRGSMNVSVELSNQYCTIYNSVLIPDSSNSGSLYVFDSNRKIVFNSTAYPLTNHTLKKVGSINIRVTDSGITSNSIVSIGGVSIQPNFTNETIVHSGIIPGNMPVLDFTYKTAAWSVTDDMNWFEEKTFWTAVEYMGVYAPAIYIISGSVFVHYALYWDWFVKAGDAAYSLTTLGSTLAAIGMIAAITFGQFELAALLFTLAIALTPVQLDGTIAISSAFNVKDNQAHISYCEVPYILS